MFIKLNKTVGTILKKFSKFIKSKLKFCVSPSTVRTTFALINKLSYFIKGLLFIIKQEKSIGKLLIC